MNENISICVVGLGYVGLPLAVAFGRTEYPTYGFDISSPKIESLKQGRDPNHELSDEEMASTKVEYSDDPSIIQNANVIIAAIPTPITPEKMPDLGPVKSASKAIGQNMKSGAIVVYESTVYPGTTEEICVPILEEESGLKFGEDFTVGYSPERINPADKEHTLEKITKIVSGSDPETLKTLSALYGTVVKVGIYEAPSLKVAEAAKVIENIQRDLNIGLINELSTIFHKLGVDTEEVLKAAETKWNFHRYRPGLVGGHCIGVDPYYLTYKAQQIGHHPQIILAGRSVNDEMPHRVADYTEKALAKIGCSVTSAKALVLGVTFKENVPDTRNSKVKDLITKLKEYGLDVDAYDLHSTSEEIQNRFTANPIDALPETATYDAIILAVPHKNLLDQSERILAAAKDPCVFMDIKSALKADLKNNSQFEYIAL